MTKKPTMKKRFCPNCASKSIRPHGFKHYDPGYKFTCDNCKHDFDTPAKTEKPN